MKKCEDCLKSYDDTWGVCLFCGTKLEREEACRKVCAIEGKDPDKISSQTKSDEIWSALIVVAAVLSIIWAVVFAGSDIWNGLLERLMYTK